MLIALLTTIVTTLEGNHGFDDASNPGESYNEGNFPSVRGIFYARGPSFR